MTLEKRFEQEMINIYTTAKKECGYNASRFLQLVSTELFSDEERKLCRDRLKEFGYPVD